MLSRRADFANLQVCFGTITPAYEDGAGGTVKGRYAGVGLTQGGTARYAAGYGYYPDGRLKRVTGPGLPTGTGSDYGVGYTYVPSSDLVEEVQFRNDMSVPAKSVHAYESSRGLVKYIGNIWRPNDQTPATLSKYTYAHDGLGLRTNVDYSGVAFSTPVSQPFGYNDRQELTSSSRGTTAWTYAYDPLGNREASRPPAEPNPPRTYVSNELDQYRRVVNPQAGLAPGLWYDGDGNLGRQFDLIKADMNCDGLVDVDDSDAFMLALQGQAAYEAEYPYCQWLNGDLNADGTVDFFDLDYFNEHLDDSGVRRVYTWDGENRLRQYAPEPGHERAGDQKVEFQYDAAGRRVEKKVYNWTGGQWPATPALHRKFVWDGWLLLLELNGLNADAVVRKYTWGLDLAGQNGASASGRSALQAAGGIGGLLAVCDANGTPDNPADDLNYVYCYDANGNVGQVVNLSAASASASLKAKYEYDPYGTRTNLPMVGEYDQPFRFSTKRFDAETGLYDFDLRLYSPALGRWISRDPVEEAGGLNLYRFALNSPTIAADTHGDFAWVIPIVLAVAYATAEYANAPGPGDPTFVGVDPRAVENVAKVGALIGGGGSIRLGWFLITKCGKVVGLIPLYYGLDLTQSSGAGLLTDTWVATRTSQVATEAAELALPDEYKEYAPWAGVAADVVGSLSAAGAACACKCELTFVRAPAAGASVWDLPPVDRGEAIHVLRGANLPRTFPVVDRFENGVVTSIKSLDLTAEWYQDLENLEQTIAKYVVKVSDFDGATRARMVIKSQEIMGRGLELAVPEGSATCEQQAVLERLRKWAQSLGVNLQVEGIR